MFSGTQVNRGNINKKIQLEEKMNTVIFKWNPAISSYSMSDFLNSIIETEEEANWSVWDHSDISEGDRFFMLKVGCGINGIVASGTITSAPYQNSDWRGDNRKVFYCDYKADVIINPETFDLLSSDVLKQEIPNFDWHGGHSGVILPATDAERFITLWNKYLQENFRGFLQRMADIEKKRFCNDQIFICKSVFYELVIKETSHD